jgi:hypothetical protein
MGPIKIGLQNRVTTHYFLNNFVIQRCTAAERILAVYEFIEKRNFVYAMMDVMQENEAEE